MKKKICPSNFQAVKWLNDLYNVLLKNHMEIGCNAIEIQSQKEEHQSFQETAKVSNKIIQILDWNFKIYLKNRINRIELKFCIYNIT